MVGGINYTVVLENGPTVIRPNVLSVDELRLTGEGDLPLTTRLGGLTLTAVVDAEMNAFLAGISDFRTVRVTLVACRPFRKTDREVLFVGYGDRGGWNRTRSPNGDHVEMSFLTPLGGADPVDINDAKTGAAYDTLPYSEAAAVVAAAVRNVAVEGSFGDLVLDNYSTIRRVTRPLGNAAEDYDAADNVRAIAVLPDDVLAVGCGRYVLLYKNRTWYAGVKIFYHTPTNVPPDKIALNAAAVAGPWTVLDLGYRSGDGKIHGIVGTRKGACAEFSFTPTYDHSYDAVEIGVDDLYWWFWDYAETFSRFTQWRTYNGEEKPEGFADVYAIGYPLLEPDKDLGTFKPQARSTYHNTEVINAGSYWIIFATAVGINVGDHVDVEYEYRGRVVQKTAVAIKVEKPSSKAYSVGVDVYIYKASTWPTKNVVVPRPLRIAVNYVAEGTAGGYPIVPVKALYHRGPSGGETSFFRPVISEVASGDEIVGPYVAFLAETTRAELGDRQFQEMPRQFYLSVPGRCRRPVGIASGWTLRQTLASRYDDQGDVWLYKNGTKVGRGNSQGTVVVVGDYVINEAISYTDAWNYYTLLKIHRYAAARNELDLVWSSRSSSDYTTGPEYYITSQAVDAGDYIYLGVRRRQRVWVDLDTEVMWSGFPSDGPLGSKGAIAIALHHDLTAYIHAGDFLKTESEPRAYKICEVSAVWRALTGVSTCPGIDASNRPLTVVVLEAPEYASVDQIKAKFCGKAVSVCSTTTDRYGVLRYNKATKAATFYPIKYNPATAKIDEVWDYAVSKTTGEEVTADETAGPVAYVRYIAEKKWPVSGTARVHVDGVEFDTQDITDAGGVPSPRPRLAYVDYAYGDDGDQLAIYLDAGYKAAKVVISYDYYPSGVEVTAIWNYGGDIYYSTSDGYIWRFDETAATCVGKGSLDDFPLLAAAGVHNAAYFVTARGCVAKFGRLHSGVVEGPFGGDDSDPFRLLAELARASITTMRQEGTNKVIYGRAATFEADDAVQISDEPVADYKAVVVNYANGRVGVGDPQARSELTAEYRSTLVYTPQHANAIASRIWTELLAARRDIHIVGFTDDVASIVKAGYVRYQKTLYRAVSVGLDRNRYNVRVRTLPLAEVSG